MIELLLIFKFSFVLCLLSGATLSLQGSHLVTRKESLQVLALAQAGLFGNLIGKVIDVDSTAVTLLCSLIFFMVVKVFIFAQKKTSETFFIVIYITLMALGYLMISIFPSLDSHMSLGLFGDVVSLSVNNTIALIGVFAVLLFLYIFHYKRFWRNSLNKALLGVRKVDWLEELLFSIAFIVSLYGLGLLYTVAFFIIPSVISGQIRGNMKGSIVLISILSGLASFLGLFSSIYFSRLSTVPSQVAILLIVLLIGKLLGTRNEKI